jgi:hypothetical protein
MSASSEPCVQLELGLFDAPSFEEILTQRRVTGLTVTATRRLRRGWYAKTERRTGLLSLHVPAYLENAPAEVKGALIDWALLASRRRNAARKKLERAVYAYIEAQGLETRNRSFVDPSSFTTRGQIYDLKEVFDFVNTTYFKGEVSSRVRWGNHLLRSYQSNRTGPDGLGYNLITIASMYDRPGVPRFAIEAIMHHEMLHIACPPKAGGARTQIHGPEFKRRERLFPRYREWVTWEKNFSTKVICKSEKPHRKGSKVAKNILHKLGFL